MRDTMGKFLLVLVLLAGAVAGGGYWNYQRNAYLDEELEDRPYAKLSLEEIDMLIEAYQIEKQKYERQLALVSQRQDPMERYSDEDLSGKLEGFDRVQRNSSQWKAVQRQMLDQEVEIDRLEREKSLRATTTDDEWNRIWRRVTTL